MPTSVITMMYDTWTVVIG